MSGEYEKDFESGAERRRSRSGAPDSGASWDGAEWGPGDSDRLPLEEGAELEERETLDAPPEIEIDAPPEGGTPATGDLAPRRRRRRLLARDLPREPLSGQKKILLLDTWRRSGLPARDFAAITGLSRQQLYAWARSFKLEGPAGLMGKRRGPRAGSRLPELTQRTILMLKESHPEWGTERISDMLLRGPALGASPGAVGRVLREAGFVFDERPTHRHPDHPREFERARPNQLWQTDLFTFMLRRQNRRVYLVAFLDDHSRYIVCYGLHATQSAQLVIEVLRSGIASYQSPEEILTDNGSQYVTWRGKSAFSKELHARGIRQIVARPRHPQTLGKIERFWGTLWREFLERAVFIDLADAQRRIGFFVDHYNFQRPHQGIGGLVPADRFFGAAADVLGTLKARVAANSLEIARNGVPRAPFYLAGNAGGRAFSVHAEGERVILKKAEGEREEIELVGPRENAEAQAEPAEKPAEMPLPLCPSASPSSGIAEEEHERESPPGVSPLDESLRRLAEGLAPGIEEEDAP